MASPTQRTWVWVNSVSWWTGRPGVLQSMGSQIVGLNWVTELELNWANSRWDQWSRFQFALSLWSHLQMRMVTGVKVTSLHHFLTTFIYLKSALVTVPILSPFVRLISEPYFNLSVRTLPARVLGEQDAGREVLGGGLFWALRLPAVRPPKAGSHRLPGKVHHLLTCSMAFTWVPLWTLTMPCFRVYLHFGEVGVEQYQKGWRTHCPAQHASQSTIVFKKEEHLL